MYERHFGFSEKPFNLTPDSRYLFLSPKHQEAYANLEFGVRERSGFLLLTGEVGTGKTTLIRHFLSQVGPDVRTAVILYPDLGAGELFHAILQDLGVPFAGGSLKDAVDTLGNALIEAKAQDLKVVVLIDEAQNLKPHVLEQLRLLSNLETEREKLLTLVLVGQPELRDMLDRPSLRQLSQRINSRSHLEPLSLDETRSYVKHRLTVAGGKGAEIDDAAVRRVHSLSGGVPRIVNLLCDRALLGAFGRGQTEVDESLVDLAAAEVLPSSRRFGPGLSTSLQWAGLFLLGLLLILPLRYCGSSEPVAPRSASVTPSPRATAPPATPMPSPSAMPSGSGSGSPAPAPVLDVRCGSVSRSRSAAIAAVEGFLGTPGFDSAQATLTFHQWRVLKLPAIAPFRTALGPCEAAVLPVDSTLTRVADATGEYEMESARLAQQYLGTAIICFVDRDGVLAKPERARLAWARKVLERRSLIAPGAPDTAVSAALARVEARVGIKGNVSVEGALLAALYSIEGWKCSTLGSFAMSLVLDALRRVDRTGPKPGSVGVTIASYRPARNRRSVRPLLLGLAMGGLLVLLFGPRTERPAAPAVSSEKNSEITPQRSSARGGAGLPPPLFAATDASVPREVETTSPVRAALQPKPVSEIPSPAPAGPAPLVLQAISERNSYPIAVINDRLVKEGDLLGAVRVLKIGSDSVDVLLENGKRDTVRFAPPPPPEPSPTLDPRF